MRWVVWTSGYWNWLLSQSAICGEAGEVLQWSKITFWELHKSQLSLNCVVIRITLWGNDGEFWAYAIPTLKSPTLASKAQPDANCSPKGSLSLCTPRTNPTLRPTSHYHFIWTRIDTVIFDMRRWMLLALAEGELPNSLRDTATPALPRLVHLLTRNWTIQTTFYLLINESPLIVIYERNGFRI